MEKLEEVIFYQIEKTLKTYRQFAQKKITEAAFDISIDQWLIMKVILEKESIMLQQISELVFKDIASVSRIIALLEKKQYIRSMIHKEDKRKMQLKVTDKGKNVLKGVQKIVQSNRRTALDGIATDKISSTSKVLMQIVVNCGNHNR